MRHLSQAIKIDDGRIEYGSGWVGSGWVKTGVAEREHGGPEPGRAWLDQAGAGLSWAESSVAGRERGGSRLSWVGCGQAVGFNVVSFTLPIDSVYSTVLMTFAT